MVREKQVTREVAKKPQKKSNKFNCSKCGEVVKEMDRQVCLTTSDKGKIIDEDYFHIQCWQDYFNEAITRKAKERVSVVQEKVKGLMDNPMLKMVLGNVKGADGLMSMLETPLTEKSVEEIQEKVEDGKRDKKSKKSKA